MNSQELKIKANKYIASKNYQDAEEIYLSIIKEDEKDIESNISLATIYFINNKFELSKKYLNQVLLISSENKELIYSRLGDIAVAENNIELAIIHYKKSLQYNENNFGSLVNLAVCNLRLNRNNEAFEGFNRAKKINSKNFALLINSGLCAYQLNKYQESIKDLKEAIEINDKYALAYFHIGNSYLSLEIYDLAELSYKKSLTIDETLTKSYINLGVLYQRTNKNNIAIDMFNKAIELDDTSYIAFNNRGTSHKQRGKYDLAISDYLKSIELNNEYYEPLSNIATTFLDLNELDKALEFINRALEKKPNSNGGIYNKGLILNQMGLKFDALKLFLELLKENKSNPDIFNIVGLILTELGHNEKSIEYHNKALELDSNSLKLNWDAAFAEIPIINDSSKKVEEIIEKFSTKLKIIEKIIEKNDNKNDFEDVVGRTQPYYIAYLDNNNKKVLKQYGDICRRIMKKYDVNSTFEKVYGRKIKLGIVSAHIRYHSVWNSFLKGIVTQIDKNKIDLYIYYLDNKIDLETILAQNNAIKYESGPKILGDWIEIIKNDQPDVLFYPEIGMNQKSLQLASIRLAKTQITSWGHPETSGLESIDYYLSSEFFETHFSEEYYVEKLVKLPGVGFYFQPPTLKSDDSNFQNLGLKHNANLILCLGLPNKFQPENDWIYIELCKKIDNIQLVFMKDGTGGYQVLENRLKLAFTNENLNYNNFVVFVPYLSRIGFNALMSIAQIQLDTLFFSSLNTTLQALGNHLPVVTLSGNYLRNNTSSGVLKTIGLTDLIALDKSDYINIICKLLKNPIYYSEIKNLIINNINKVYKDRRVIVEFENFLLNLK